MNLVALQYDSPSGSYSQSVACISDFVKWIESQAPAPYPANIPYTNAFNSFNILKQDSIRWFNSIYPSCIQILDSIVFADPQVTACLDTMCAVAEQLEDDSDNQQLHKILAANAQMLIVTLSGIKNDGDRLEAASGQFLSDLNTDFNNLSYARNSLIIEIQAQYNYLSSLYAQLHSLESKSCKSEGDINACKSQIDSQQALINTLTGLDNIIVQALSRAGATLQSLAYLRSFWSLITDDAQNCIDILNQIIIAPVIVLELDIQNARNAWNELYNIANESLQQLPASYRADIKEE